jgi:hypothetical protein
LGTYYFLSFVFLDCPGPQSESAGKSDACAGCPNQEVCATAPKGPDPGKKNVFLKLQYFASILPHVNSI